MPSDQKSNSRPVAVITGASRGIGKEIAQSFGRLKWNVVVNYKASEDAAKEVADFIAKAGGCAVICRADVSTKEGAICLIEKAKEAWGRIDVLVNNAGVVLEPGCLSLDVEAKEWGRVVAVNLNACFFCSQEAARIMKIQQSGSIVNLSSVLAFLPAVGNAPYGAAKAGIVSLTKTFAKELGRYNIRVNAVAPGLVETDMIKGVPEKVKSMAIEQSALRRLGRPEDIAEVVIFLAVSGLFITGQTIRVDGGL